MRLPLSNLSIFGFFCIINSYDFSSGHKRQGAPVRLRPRWNNRRLPPGQRAVRIIYRLARPRLRRPNGLYAGQPRQTHKPRQILEKRPLDNMPRLKLHPATLRCVIARRCRPDGQSGKLRSIRRLSPLYKKAVAKADGFYRFHRRHRL